MPFSVLYWIVALTIIAIVAAIIGRRFGGQQALIGGAIALLILLWLFMGYAWAVMASVY